MARSKNPLVYPSTFFTIVKRLEEVLPLDLPRDSLREAQHLRFMFYDFRRALESARHPLAEKAAKVSISILKNANGSCLLHFNVLGNEAEEGLLQAIETRLGQILPRTGDNIDEEERAAMRRFDEGMAAGDFDNARRAAGLPPTSGRAAAPTDTGMPTLEALMERYVKSGEFKGGDGGDTTEPTQPEDIPNIAPGKDEVPAK